MDTQNNDNTGNNAKAPEPEVVKTTPMHGGDKTLFGVLSYLGPLVIVSYLVKKDDPFIKFHIRQGLVLLSIQVILWILTAVFFIWSLWPVYNIVHFVLIILSILGIINVAQGKEKELPLVGQFAHYFHI